MVELVTGLDISYSNVENIEQMWEKARFVRQPEAGIRESGPHDVEGF